jgi:starch phosphorylase
LAKTLVSGAEVWLNTPEPPLEASGTSGMKAALNGVLNLSVLDGWWVEAAIEGVTGWSIGQDGGPGQARATAQDL